MKPDSDTIEKLSSKFSKQFTYRMRSAAHLQADLKQEAAIAIVLNAPRWRKGGGANFETFTRIFAWKAMQCFCSMQAGPVGRAFGGRDFSGTGYGSADSGPDFAPGENREHGKPDNDFAPIEHRKPDDFLERKNADEIVREFVERRAARFTGRGHLSIESVKSALHDLMRGDTCAEVGARYGCSRQHVSMLAAKAEIV